MKNYSKLDKLQCEMLPLNFISISERYDMKKRAEKENIDLTSFGRACRDPESHAVFAIVISGSNLPLFSDNTTVGVFIDPDWRTELTPA
jgi:hypothetical protein